VIKRAMMMEMTRISEKEKQDQVIAETQSRK
jgi:hypothetical protein